VPSSPASGRVSPDYQTSKVQLLISVQKCASPAAILSSGLRPCIHDVAAKTMSFRTDARSRVGWDPSRLPSVAAGARLCMSCMHLYHLCLLLHPSALRTGRPNMAVAVTCLAITPRRL
jgi:hypothetical protein